jgi:hypothetical protein
MMTFPIKASAQAAWGWLKERNNVPVLRSSRARWTESSNLEICRWGRNLWRHPFTLHITISRAVKGCSRPTTPGGKQLPYEARDQNAKGNRIVWGISRN